MNDYNISQSTLNLLYEVQLETNNFYLKFVIKYLQNHALIQKGLVIKEQFQTYQDPVQRIIFLSYLQTQWNKTWNALQGFEGWWSPFFFQAQKNHPFNSKEFIFNQKREGRVEWSVMNFITKDFCKCFVEPQFIIPEYAVLSKYQKDYVHKECYLQDFKMIIAKLQRGQILSFNKNSNSIFDKVKNKLLLSTQIEQKPKKKETTQYKDFTSPCLFIGILTIIQGVLRLKKDGFIIFSSKHQDKRFDHMCVKAFKNESFQYLSIHLEDIRKIYKKRYNASNNAINVKLKDGRQFMFHFYNKNLDSFLSLISNKVKIKKESYSNYINGNQPVKWIEKYMSNFEYLQWLNQIGGRSFTDITQYPVLPWTFVSSSTKLETEQKFRDLTKNMGLQGDKDRIRYFEQKYSSDNNEELFNQYHFGTHYSSSAIIFNFLIRIRPFSIGALTLQSGKFDVADRIFYSFCGSWNNAISSPTDLRELIPEIYTLPEMFINQNNYEYGITQEKVVVDNVILPDWCEGNPYRFVVQLRRRLESRYVSENINHWIDLIYGYKQRGKDAIESMNIFYPLTYENCIDLDKVHEADEKESFETQIAHFGQHPAQIIGNNPHPKRLATKANWQEKLVSDGNQLVIQKCFLGKAGHIEEKIIFKSVFQSRNAILGVKFLTEQLFFVLRKHDYFLFQILNEKSNFLSKQQETSYELQSIKTNLDYKHLSTFVPMTTINHEVLIVGGFYHGIVQIIFLKQSKFNNSFRFPNCTITAIAYHKIYHYLYIADAQGYINVYKVNVSSKQLDFQHLIIIKAHDSKINDLVINYNANLITVCSQDCSISFYNCYSLQIMRNIKHPANFPVHFAQITTSPLYAVIFYSKQNSTIYVYSINGQFLDSFCQKTGFIYNMSILRSTDSTQSLVYLNANRQLFIWQIPFLKLKRKVKVKKDEFRISCFQTCENSKIAITGTEDGALQILANPASY